MIGRVRVVGLLLLLRIMGAVLAFVLTLVLARTMAPDEMGRAMALMSTAILLSVAVSGGMEAGVVRFVARYHEAGTPSAIRGLLRTTRGIALVFGTVCAAGAGIVAWKGVADLALVAALVAAAVLGITRVGAAHALAFGGVIASLLPSTFLRQFFLFSAIMVAVAALDRLTEDTVLAAFLMATVLALAVQFWMNRHIPYEVGRGPTDVSQWREWTTYGLQMAPTLLFVQYSRDLTLFVAAWTLPAAGVAVLGVVMALTAFVKFALAAVNQSITPTMATLIERADHNALMDLVRSSNMLKMGIVAVSVVGSVLLGGPILGLFGETFQDAMPILLLLLIEPFVLAMFGPAGQYLALSGHQAVMIPIAFMALAVMAIGITLGAWFAGVPGAAAGTAVGWAVWSASLARRVRRQSGIDLTMFVTLTSRYTKGGS